MSSASSASWSTSTGASASARSADERSATATRTCEWPRSMPSATPADGSRRSSAGGRPRPPERATARRRRPRRRGRALWRSPTSVATVVRDRPVSCASSLRVAVPLRRSASTTRRRLPSRSASREPSAASPRTLRNLLAQRSLLSRAWPKKPRNTPGFRRGAAESRGVSCVAEGGGVDGDPTSTAPACAPRGLRPPSVAHAPDGAPRDRRPRGAC